MEIDAHEVNVLNIWMILSIILLVVVALSGANWAKAAKQRDENAARLTEMESLRAELDRVRTDAYQCRRRIDALNDALSEEYAYSDQLIKTLDDRETQISTLNQRLEQAGALRVRAEKDASGAQLKAQLYERQYDKVREEYAKLEKRYRESKKECDALAMRTAGNVQKRKSKKAESFEQISMSELFDMH